MQRRLSTSGLQDARRHFLVPHGQGAVLVDPGHIPINKLPPAVVIEEFIADARPYAAAGTVAIGPGAKNFEFHYAGLSFLAPQKVLFRYMLDGFDKEWAEAGVRRVAYYTHVPPGNYRFRVVACNSDGVWNLAGAALDLSVKPHFSQTTLFYSLCILAFISVGPGAYLLRVRQMRARERVLKARVEDALANIRRLRGLLPICASCKSIRDDKGYWNEIESYIRDHSEADFSHGICPSCVRKLYPEIADQISSRSQQRELPQIPLPLRPRVRSDRGRPAPGRDRSCPPTQLMPRTAS